MNETKLTKYHSQVNDLMILNWFQVCKVVNRQGHVQWTKDGFGLDTPRDLPGYSRYRMVGNEAAGRYLIMQFMRKSWEDNS